MPANTEQTAAGSHAIATAMKRSLLDLMVATPYGVDVVWVLPLVAVGVMSINTALSRALYLPAVYAFVVPALLPLGLTLAFYPDPIVRGLGLGYLTYLVALVLFARTHNGSHRRRFEA